MAPLRPGDQRSAQGLLITPFAPLLAASKVAANLICYGLSHSGRVLAAVGLAGYARPVCRVGRRVREVRGEEGCGVGLAGRSGQGMGEARDRYRLLVHDMS